MSFDRNLFAKKIRGCCDQFEITRDELSEKTGIATKRLKEFENKIADPTGDEVLILADFFKCDFKYFISNERVASFDKTELMFRKYGNLLSKSDRWSIQEFIYLCENEEYLYQELNKQRQYFNFTKTGDYFKGHGVEAASALRRHLGYPLKEVPLNIYEDFSRIGLHVFRRELEKSDISGICIRHPFAGDCLLINYKEDLFRQRFSAAHEAGHAILDKEADFVISLNTWDRKDLVEIRANTFASNYLMPPGFLKKLSESVTWDETTIRLWAGKMMVNIQPLLYALRENKIIVESQFQKLEGMKLRLEKKSDPEILDTLSPNNKTRKIEFLKRGLSTRYVDLCFEAFENKLISTGRLAEMLLIAQTDIIEVAKLYGKSIDLGA